MIRLSRRFVQLTLLGRCVGIALAATAQRAIRVFRPSGWGLEPAGDPTPIGDMLAGGVPSPNAAWLAFAFVGQGVHKAYVVRRESPVNRSGRKTPVSYTSIATTSDVANVPDRAGIPLGFSIGGSFRFQTVPSTK